MIVKKSLYQESERPRNVSSQPTVKEFKQSKNLSKAFNIFKLLNFTKTLLILVLLVQVIILYLAINPINLLNQLYIVNVVNKVSAKAAVPPTEIPTVATIGDNTTLAGIDELKALNEVYASIFKDAQNGDSVLAYTKKMIIYRQNEDKIIYEGERPDTIINASLQTTVSSIVDLAKRSGLIKNESTETPQVSVVTDAGLIKQQNPQFYADIQNNDLVATFGTSSLVIIYRPSSNTIIKSGQISVK